MLMNEIQILQQVDHSNIIKYYETYDDKNYIFLCMELLNGGELLDSVGRSGKMSEKDAVI